MGNSRIVLHICDKIQVIFLKEFDCDLNNPIINIINEGYHQHPWLFVECNLFYQYQELAQRKFKNKANISHICFWYKKSYCHFFIFVLALHRDAISTFRRKICLKTSHCWGLRFATVQAAICTIKTHQGYFLPSPFSSFVLKP